MQLDLSDLNISNCRFGDGGTVFACRVGIFCARCGRDLAGRFQSNVILAKEQLVVRD